MNLHGNEKEFFRLMGLPLPVPELHQHYLDMLCSHDRFMFERIQKFNEYAQWCLDMGHKSVQSYRLDHAMGAFATWTKSNDLLKDIEYPDVKFIGKDHRGAHVNEGPAPKRGERKVGLLGIGNGNALGVDNHPLISFDLKEANYSVLRLGAKQKGVAVPQDWAGFCDDVLRLHPFLATSKMFRQYCFGNYAPKTCTKVQTALIQTLVDQFDLQERAVYISSDEIVMPYEKEAYLHNDIVNLIHDSIFDGAMSVKDTLYEMYRIDGDCMLKVVYDGGRLEERTRQLFAVPATKHYMMFRQHILDQPLEDNDLLFRHEGRTARWVV